MKKLLLIAFCVLVLLGGIAFISRPNKQSPKKTMTDIKKVDATNSLTITPISHATMVLHLAGQIVYVDPVGGKEAFSNQPEPTIILITDIHDDHMDMATLKEVSKDQTILVVPKAVKDELPDDIPGLFIVLQNGDTTTQKGIDVEAVPMYNIPESPSTFHTKGRGNGYVISGEGKRIYIAGDTSATPEMKALKNIDIAFIPMNLPFTMTEEEAAEGVLAFKPKVVHPYHYRGQNGLSDIQKFKKLVEEKDTSISVQPLNFYPAD